MPATTPSERPGQRPPWLFYLLLWGLLLGASGLFVYAFSGAIRELAGKYFFQYAVKYLPRRYQEEVVERLSNRVAGIYDSIPDPEVGRVLQANVIKTLDQVAIYSNNAGLRARRPYLPKKEGAFRIACLGDSYVFGDGGAEEDRIGDRIESLCRRKGITGAGGEVEVYSLGIPSWSTVNEAAYLTARLSAYAPDLIVVFMVSNDFGDSSGVTGAGTVTDAFTPDPRAAGSGVFSVYASGLFGVPRANFLSHDLGPECRGRWEKAFSKLRRLEDLQTARGGRILLMVLRDPYLPTLAAYHHARSGLRMPLLITDYLMEKDSVLPHDPHPSRRGHEIMAIQLLRLLLKLGWLEGDGADLPALHPQLDLIFEHRVAEEEVAALRKNLAEQFLPEKIDFQKLRESDLAAFLGGVLPAEFPPRALEAAPYGTLRTGFLLQAVPGARRASVEIEVAPFPELYPFRLQMYVQGRPAAVLELSGPAEAGRHRLAGEIPLGKDEPAVEVILRSDNHYCGIADPRMKSYRILSLAQE